MLRLALRLDSASPSLGWARLCHRSGGVVERVAFAPLGCWARLRHRCFAIVASLACHLVTVLFLLDFAIAAVASLGLLFSLIILPLRANN